MVTRVCCRLLVLCLVVGVDADDNERAKRFFHNFQSYFAKSTSPTMTTTTTTTTSAAEPLRSVRVLGAPTNGRELCVDGGNCSQAKFDWYDASTPLPFLTPPTLDQEKQFGNEYASIYGPSGEYANQANGNFHVTVFNGTTGEPFSANEKGAFHVLPFSSGADTDLLKVRLKDLLCVKSTRNGRFSVEMITSKSLPAVPTIENGYTSEHLPQCSVTTIGHTAFQIKLKEPDMIKCGVHYCDSDVETNLMCLTLRFPAIYGIRTNSDIVMRIECHPQQQILSHIKQFKMKPNLNAGRSLPLYGTIAGTSPNQMLRSQVGLYALTELGYTQLLGSTDIVSVGQYLQLRSAVKSGDGKWQMLGSPAGHTDMGGCWNYSRFGQILIQKISSPIYGYGNGEGLDSVVVVADDGCVNPLMKPICPLGPFNDPGDPLISTLNLQMFEFNNMKDGDELSISVTIFGCIHYEDCFTRNGIQCQNWPTSNRYKRSFHSQNLTDVTSEITVRVRYNDAMKDKYFKCDEIGCYEAMIMSPTKEYYLILLLFILFGTIILTGYLLCYYACLKLFHSRVL